MKKSKFLEQNAATNAVFWFCRFFIFQEFTLGIHPNENSDRLPNVVERVKLDGFDHMDFLWGTRAPTYLYSEIIDFIKDASINFDYTQPIK